MGNKIGVFYSQASYLKRDLFSTGIIFFFTSLHYNGSLTSFNYYPVYIGYFYLLYRSVWFCSVKKCMSDGFVNILSSITIALIFITFFGDLTNVRYHLYIVPIIISAFVFYFNYKGISSNYIVYAGLLISTIGMYKFISESYGLV